MPQGDIRPRSRLKHGRVSRTLISPWQFPFHSLRRSFLSSCFIYLSPPLGENWRRTRHGVTDKTAPVLTIVPSVATPIVMPLCCSALMVAEADLLHSRSAGSE